MVFEPTVSASRRYSCRPPRCELSRPVFAEWHPFPTAKLLVHFSSATTPGVFPDRRSDTAFGREVAAAHRTVGSCQSSLRSLRNVTLWDGTRPHVVDSIAAASLARRVSSALVHRHGVMKRYLIPPQVSHLCGQQN